MYLMDTECKFETCDRPARRTGLCLGHYKQVRNGKQLTHIDRTPRPDECSLSYCDKPHKGRGYCQGHLRQITTGRPLGELRPYKLDAGRKNQEGYILLYLPEYEGSGGRGYIMEHRYVMEQHLGRLLKRHENVHHKNGVRDDNRIENLELWVRPQPAGQRLDDLLRWVIDNYSDELREELK